MADNLHIAEHASREEKYRVLLPQVAQLLNAESDLIANLANIASALKMTFDFFWVGFYRRIGEELVLGPFQGSLACTRITLARGVCGTCATQKKTLVVPDVEQFPGHIACSSLSRSEIVVPLVSGADKVELVLDVDSDRLGDFNQEVDGRYLEEVVEMVRARHFG